MHPYATNSTERKMVVVYLTITGVLLAYALNRLLQVTGLTVPWFVDAPSVMGFFGGLYWVFDRYLWKLGWMRSISLVRVPDLNGKWSGEVHSSFSQLPTQINVNVEICQTWTALLVKMDSGVSHSKSVMGAIFVGDDGSSTLTYEYSNEPRALALDTMHAHRGTAYLVLKKHDNRELLEGDYYAGRDRQNVGQITLERRQHTDG